MRFDVLVVVERTSAATIDVIADAAGRNDAAFVGIRGTNTADAKAVAPMDVRHRQAGILNPGEKRDIGNLIGRVLICSMSRSSAKMRPSTHTLLVALGNAAAIVDLFPADRDNVFPTILSVGPPQSNIHNDSANQPSSAGSATSHDK